MKALKIFLFVIGVIVLIFLALAYMGPKHVHIERSVQIDAPADFVMAHANTFEQMRKWGPWEEKDPNMTVSFDGIDGTLGAKYMWEGNDQVGKGNQVISSISDTHITTELNFIEPWEGHSLATFTVKEHQGATIATWAFDNEPNLFASAMGAIFSMDEMLGPDFEHGMNNLKAFVEGDKPNRKTFNGMEVMIEEMSPRTYVGVREVVQWQNMTAFFGSAYGKIYPMVEKNGLAPVGAPSAIYFTWDEVNKQADILAAAPLAQGSTIKSMTSQDVSGKVLVIDYYGDYEGLGRAHEAMDQYMQWHKVEFGGMAIEEYITDPMSEPDSSKWHTRLYYTIN